MAIKGPVDRYFAQQIEQRFPVGSEVTYTRPGTKEGSVMTVAGYNHAFVIGKNAVTSRVEIKGEDIVIPGFAQFGKAPTIPADPAHLQLRPARLQAA